MQTTQYTLISDLKGNGFTCEYRRPWDQNVQPYWLIQNGPEIPYVLFSKSEKGWKLQIARKGAKRLFSRFTRNLAEARATILKELA